jgi:hypothetical protein
MDNLKTIRDSKNKTAFDSFVSTTLKDDFHDATSQLNDLKKDLRKYNATNTTKTELRNEFKTLQRDYSDCINNKDEAMAKVMLRYYQKTQDRWDAIIAKMQKRGISTEEINNLTDELHTLIQKLQDAIDSGNKTEMQKVVSDIRDEQLHLWARFQIYRLNGYINKISPVAKEYGKSGQMKDVEDKLDSIQKYTEKGYKYKEGDVDKVWSELQDASKELKDTSRDLLKENKQEIKDLKKSEKSNRGDSESGSNNRGKSR